MTLWADKMTREQLAACKLMARAAAGEHGLSVRMVDMQNIRFVGDCSPNCTYNQVLFQIGMRLYGATYKLVRGLLTCEFECFGGVEQ